MHGGARDKHRMRWLPMHTHAPRKGPAQPAPPFAYPRPHLPQDATGQHELAQARASVEDKAGRGAGKGRLWIREASACP